MPTHDTDRAAPAAAAARTDSGSGRTAAEAGSGAAAIKRSLVGRGYDEQVQMLSPTAASTAGPSGAGASGAAATGGSRDPRSPALSKQLRDEATNKTAEWKRLDDRVQEIDGQLATVDGEAKESLEAEKRDLEKKAKVAWREGDQARKDADTLESGAASMKELNDVNARRGSKGDAGREEPTTTTRRSASAEKGLVSETTTESNRRTSEGASRTDASTTTTEIGLTGGSVARSDSQTEVKGEATRKKTDTTKDEVDLAKGNYARTTTRRDETAVADKKSGTSTAQTTTVGVGGASYSKTDTTFSGKDGKDSVARTTTGGVTRGDGKLGTSTTVSEKKTQGEAESSVSSTTNKGLIAGKDGVGGYANKETSASKKTASGLECSGKAAAGGRASYNIVKIPGSSPPAYRIQTSITLDASLSASAGGSKGDPKSDKPSGSFALRGDLSASITASFGAKLDEEATAAWKEQLAAAEGGAGSGRQEHQIIATGVTQGWGAARDLYERMRGGGGVTANLKDGESAAIKVDGKAGVGIDASGKGYGASIGVSGGYGKTTSVEGEVQRNGDTTTTTLKVSDGTEASGSIKVGSGPASFKLGGKTTQSSGTGYKFNIKDDTPGADALRAELETLHTQAEIEAFAKAHPELVSERTKTKGQGTETSQGIAVGPADATLTSGGSTNEEHVEAYDPETGTYKKVSDTYSGESHVGGKVKLGPVELGSNRKEELTSTVRTVKDEAGNDKQVATGDLKDDRSESSPDVAGSVEGLTDKPLGKLFGSDPLLKQEEKKDVSGVFLSDADFERIMQLAKDPHAWKKGFSRVANGDDWEACRREVLAAGNDKELVAKALAKFMGGGQHDRTVNVKELIGADVGGGGGRYELPDGLADLKGTYLRLVVNDPRPGIQSLASQGKVPEAAEQADTAAREVESMFNRVNAHGAEFKDGNIHAEMLGRMGKRQVELQNLATQLRATASGKNVSQDALDKVGAVRKYNMDLDLCRSYSETEDRLFAKLGELWDGTTGQTPEQVKLVNELRANIKLWKPVYANMAMIAETWHIGDAKIYARYQPDEARTQMAYAGKNPMSDSAQDKAAENASWQRAREDNANAAHRQMKQVTGMAGQAVGDVDKDEDRKALDAAAKAQRGKMEALRPERQLAYANAQRAYWGARRHFDEAMRADGGTHIAGSARAKYGEGMQLAATAEDAWRAAEAAFGTTSADDFSKVYNSFVNESQRAVWRMQEAAEAFQDGDRATG
ncbi:MAG: hypothetical protein U1F43_33440 [Myxococcota bacterium]